MARQELIDASDEALEDALLHADMLVLRGLLYQLTGDESVVAIPHEKVPMGFRGLVPAIVDPEHVAFLRKKAFDFLKAYRDRCMARPAFQKAHADQLASFDDNAAPPGW